MTGLWRGAAGACMAAALAGCSMGGLGGPTPVASAPPPPAAPAPVVYGPFLEGPVGLKLTAADRDKALAAEQEALASGQRKTWRGDHGAYGYAEAAPGGPQASSPVLGADAASATTPAAPLTESCRSFTSTIYIAGRPQVGHGRGCQNPDGSYRIVS